MSIWKQLNHLKKTDKWGNPDKMDGFLLWLLDKIEGMSGKKAIIHCGYEEDGHANSSYHSRDGKGRAVDFHLEGLATRKQIYTAWMIVDSILTDLQVADEVGLGVYLDWREGTLGFHIDTRGEKMRWIRNKGVYDYKFDAKKLK